ncbi:hemerythrin domain-containing protein [Halopseudomonas xiamenensis]|uniref:hemerythrin domain-containing protein n=1 Tax=Halopseudomonas xiamenensis TaxID=157792 RepID=UPI00162450E8|nr:hemerythrin domain-containing protein [Halopseudomonas xiamenensis]
MTIFEALRVSHDRQRQYVEAVLLTSGDTPERVDAYQQLKEELHAHETAEERYFYIPLMAHENGVDLSRHAIAEHHEMDELMEKLDDTDMSSPAWLATARALGDKVLHHLREEEQKFFQMAGKLLTDRQKSELADQYNDEYEELLGQQD